MNSVYIILIFILAQSSNVIFNIFFVEEEAREAKCAEPTEVSGNAAPPVTDLTSESLWAAALPFEKGQGLSHLSPRGFRREAVSAVEKHRPFSGKTLGASDMK